MHFSVLLSWQLRGIKVLEGDSESKEEVKESDTYVPTILTLCPTRASSLPGLRYLLFTGLRISSPCPCLVIVTYAHCWLRTAGSTY
jgi:hypothetical protein